jgi:hypothetical protein
MEPTQVRVSYLIEDKIGQEAKCAIDEGANEIVQEEHHILSEKKGQKGNKVDAIVLPLGVEVVHFIDCVE